MERYAARFGTGNTVAFRSFFELCIRDRPLTEPETLYITGGEVRCSVVEEDYLPRLERLGRL